MTLKLFDEIVGDDCRSAGYSEPEYEYLNRTARPPFARIRILLQEWADRYPDLVNKEWLGRFRSDDDRHHIAAYFELHCRALLDHEGFSVEREADHATNSPKRIEFRVSRNELPAFLLECTVAAGPDFGSGEQKRIGRFHDAVDRIGSPDFFLHVSLLGLGRNDLPTRGLRTSLGNWLSRLDPEQVGALYEAGGLSALPRFQWDDRGWKVDFAPVPKKPEARGKPGHGAIGSFMSAFKKIDTAGPLLAALRSKASRYGELALPYIIAVNALDTFVSEESFTDALFGRENKVVWNLSTGEATLERSPDGFWCGPSGPTHKRVSAVLFARHLTASRTVSETPVLWHNPWAERPLDPDLWLGPQMVADQHSGMMQPCAGKTAAKLLGLPPQWPGYSDDDSDS